MSEQFDAPDKVVGDGAASQRPRQLTRPRKNRIIGGVAAGLAQYFGIDPVIVRLVFVVLAVAGGGGVLAYLIAWIIIPSAPEDGQESDSSRTSAGTQVVAGLVLVVIGALLLVDMLVPAFSWRYVGPAMLIALGVLLVGRRATSS